MTDIDMKGRFRTTHKKLASGQKKIYYHTKPGGTLFFECYGQPLVKPYPTAFIEAYKDTVKTEPGPTMVEGDCAQFIIDYLSSPKFEAKAEQTQAGYIVALNHARSEFGKASIAVIEDRRFRGAILNWQQKHAKASPRQADLNVQLLSLALDHAYKRGLLMHNPAKDIDNLYARPEDKRPWEDYHGDAFLDGATQQESDAYWLARYTGLRRTDLARVTWSSWNGDRLDLKTSKGRGKRRVIIPLTPEAQAFLQQLKDRQAGQEAVTMLVGTRGRPVQPRRIGDLVNTRAGKLELDRTLHNLRNTYARDLIRAGFSHEDIAETMGWTLEDVRQMSRVYVHQDEINTAKITRLQQNRT